MKSWTAPGYRIANSRTEVKFAYTGFLAFTLVGLGTMIAFHVGRIGFSVENVASFYRGGDVAGQMRFPKTYGELLEITHFHAFTMGTVYLILAHLFAATAWPAWLRSSALGLTLSAALLDLAIPWLVRFGSASFAALALVAWTAQWIGYGTIIVGTLIDRWRPRALHFDDDEGDADEGDRGE